ncbi:MAG: PspC domain-containing protein [Motilibacteraceae bacterium]
MTTVPPTPAERAPYRRYTRSSRGRLVAGVCSGLAEHLGFPVLWVRAGLLLLALAGGAGVVAYGALWALAPLDDAPPTDAEAADADPVGAAGREIGLLLALGALLLGAVLLLHQFGLGVPAGLAWPVAVGGTGVAVLWRQADDAQRDRWRRVAASGASATGRAARVRLGVGAVLLVMGVVLFAARRGDAALAGGVLLAVLVVTAGLALVTAPWWLQVTRELRAERAARIREQERAEIAAHVHDSVLHTLALIQRNAEDPRAVARLARSQERELRSWLYRPTSSSGGTLASALPDVVAEVEDAHGVAVELVVVGDVPVDRRVQAVLLAAREALVNAAKYADGAPVSVYAEVEPTMLSVFVRDRGPGFELSAVSADRLGVRQSIVGRMARHGGRAQVRTAPGEGTEVRLELPLDGAMEQEQPVRSEPEQAEGVR